VPGRTKAQLQKWRHLLLAEAGFSKYARLTSLDVSFAECSGTLQRLQAQAGNLSRSTQDSVWPRVEQRRRRTASPCARDSAQKPDCCDSLACPARSSHTRLSHHFAVLNASIPRMPDLRKLHLLPEKQVHECSRNFADVCLLAESY
jgi:hypothetical protein